MTVEELIAELELMNPDAVVKVYDSGQYVELLHGEVTELVSNEVYIG